MATLTDAEFIAVSKTFFARLSNEMSNAGCNDVFPDEFPQSVCEKFQFDSEVFDVWKKMILDKIKV